MTFCSRPSSATDTEPLGLSNGDVIDCVVSKWGDWTECSVHCGAGFMLRSREIIIEPLNGGRKCPKHMRKRRACRMPPC
jgi:hypothetical protein